MSSARPRSVRKATLEARARPRRSANHARSADGVARVTFLLQGRTLISIDGVPTIANSTDSLWAKNLSERPNLGRIGWIIGVGGLVEFTAEPLC